MSIDHQRVDDYVLNRLDEVERDRFETELLENTDQQSAVIVTRALSNGLRQSPVASLRRPYRRPAAILAMAASVLLVVSIGFNITSIQDPEIDEIIYVEKTRSVGNPVYQFADDKQVLLSVDMGPVEAGPYTIEFSGKSGIAYQQAGLSGTPDHYLNVLVPKLEPGTYSLTIYGRHSTAQYDVEVTGAH